MFDRLRPSSRPWTLIAAIALVAFNAACTSPATPPAAVVPVAASGAAAPLPGMHAPELATGWTDKPGWTAQHYMIAAANPLATQAGYEMLKAGGTAVDAAIATQMVLALVEPQSSGIGGGAFMLYFDGKTTQAYDGRETAPAAATDRLFYGPTGQPMSFYEGVVGGRSVGTPGVLRMLEAAHRANGKLPWRRLFQPAIRLAEHGFTISPRLATLIANDRYLMNDPAARAYFYNKDGTPKAAGTVLKNPALAAVLRQVADRGANAFYTGAIARDIVAKVRKHPTNPGLLSMQDLARYKAKVRAPLCADYRRSIVCGMPPPSSGGLAIAQMLGILEAMPDWQQIGAQKPVRNEVGYEPTPFAAHVFSEAGRLAYADRARYVADPDFVPLPGGNWASLIDKSYLAQRAQLIGDNSMGVAQAGTPQGATLAMADDLSPELPSTSDIAIVDRYGHALSMTTSIEDAFGSRLMVRGFLLNNQLTDFSFVSTENGRPVANRVQPGKRPRSAMSPELVFDKKTKQVTLIVGSAGGPAIINHVAKALVGVLDWGMTMQQAIALPNFGSMNGPTQLERGRVSDALVDGLKGRGHDVQLVQMNSGLQGIQRLNVQGQTVWFGGADPRREGVAMGE
ncbi:gamma-glutamyltransferase [Burkholderia multivorans]|uniref:gamma-glutamyltransferase n=1 Tax=Burkholderia multivorans TaxID=87883 RepID=UPI0004F65F1E|nr:gamma-glutamyltransferase [Burkholderia multivorans]AIO75756.1 gamma-glutamyltransferase [Burkholderia multivorans]AOK68696.1 gamma-glutamyltransferase [Burkholderia multivorans]KVZ79085.1 gamma-glutamyltransferase [Burkholderia multivorans]MBU9388286.1 gamma-glutamyltransferase [Burkholderia multivorans]